MTPTLDILAGDFMIPVELDLFRFILNIGFR